MPRFEQIKPALPPRADGSPFTGQAESRLGRPELKTVFEIERHGVVIETCLVREWKRPKHAVMRFATPAIAETRAREIVASKKRQKFVEVGPSRLLVAAKGSEAGKQGSTLLLDELFASGEPRFLEEVLGCTDDAKLVSIAESWLADARPEMRRALLEYVDDGCDRPFHKGLVKRLFKGAERASDDPLMARFMVAFDRIVSRFPVKTMRWEAGVLRERVVLHSNPVLPETIVKKSARTVPRFSRATRRYLVRRAFRYFRKIGRSDKARYGRAMRVALPLYRDEHLDTPVRLLDSWALMHVLYAWSPAIERLPRGVRVAKGRSLAELAPEPYFEQAWLGVSGELLAMVGRARSRTVRKWTIAWLENRCSADLEGFDVAALRPLVASEDEDVARFGSKLLGSARGLATLPVEEWLALLSIENVEVAPVVAQLFEKNVSPKRLTLAQIVDLTGTRVAGVAELGLRWARALHSAAGDREARALVRVDYAVLGRIATAPVESVRREGTRWLLELLDAAPETRREPLRDLFDSRFPDVRALAIAYLEQKKAADVPLWFALLESPYEDVRALVVEHAESWQAQAGAAEIEHLAASVLLAVHRGSATKQSMLRQIADRAAERPEDADRLLPVLSIALRSVRPPERIGALAAIARAAVAHESLRAAVGRHLPELSISNQVTS